MRTGCGSVWINKLPFAPFADPVIAARLALEVEQAELRGEEDPEAYAQRALLPAARGAVATAGGWPSDPLARACAASIVISDRKLAGPTRLAPPVPQVFLGSLDPGLMRADAGDRRGVARQRRHDARGLEAHLRLLRARGGHRRRAGRQELSTEQRLVEFTELPETLAILEQELSAEEERSHRDAGTLEDEVLRRADGDRGQLNSAQGTDRS